MCYLYFTLSKIYIESAAAFFFPKCCLSWTLKYTFQHRDGNPASCREEMVNRKKRLEEPGCWMLQNQHLQDSLLLSVSDRRARFFVRKAFAALKETCSHPPLLCFYSRHQPTPGPICHKRLSNFPPVITPCSTFQGLHQSFQKLVFNHSPTISTFLEAFLKEKRKIFHCLVHSL